MSQLIGLAKGFAAHIMDDMNTVSNLRRRFSPKPATPMSPAHDEARRIHQQHIDWELIREVGTRGNTNAAALTPMR